MNGLTLFRSGILIALQILFSSSIVTAHDFDTSFLGFDRIGQQKTFTILDRTGCTAFTQIQVLDPTVVTVDPPSTGPVVTQTYTVTALKPGSTGIVIFWQGNTEFCTEDSSHFIEVVVDVPASEATPTACPQDKNASIRINVTSDPARAGGTMSVELTFFPPDGSTPVTITATANIFPGDLPSTIAFELMKAIKAAMAQAGLSNCLATVSTTQFDSVYSVVVSCTCFETITGRIPSNPPDGTGIGFVDNPEPTATSTPTPTQTQTPSPTPSQTPTPSPTRTPTYTPSETATQIVVTPPTPTPVVFPGMSLDIHPVQVVQEPPAEELEEEIPIMQYKSTMFRVFVIWSPPDPTHVANAVCTINVGGVQASIQADLFYEGGQTFVIPKEYEGTAHSATNIRFRGLNSFNFEFPETLGYHPQGSTMDVSARLDFPGATVASANESFDLRLYVDSNDGRLYLSFRTLETQGKPFLKSDSQLRDFARQQFERVVAVYPAARRYSDFGFTRNTIVYPSFNTLNMWLLAGSLDVPSLSYVDRFVWLTPGSSRQPPRTGFLTDWTSTIFDSSAVSGYAPYTVGRFVFVAENAASFTTAHEHGHQILGAGHDNVPSANGWDVRHVAGSRVVKHPLNHRALMETTANDDSTGWISREEYESLINLLSRPSAKVSNRLRHFGGSIFVSGKMLSDGTFELAPFFTSETTPDLNILPGEYAIRQLNRNGEVLHEQSFTLSAMDAGEDTVPFFFGYYLPFSDETTTIQILLRDQVIEERPVTDNPPSLMVESLEPAGNGRYRVHLNADDPDGDPLNFAASYVPNASQAEVVFIEWIQPGSEFEFDASGFPGSDAGWVDVMVTDGVHAVRAVSPLALFPNQRPSVAFALPRDGDVYAAGSAIELDGYGYDAEDGVLTSAQLTWQSSMDGVIGNGDTLFVSNLSPGSHNITLQAIDSAGQTAEQSVTVTVQDENAPPDLQVRSVVAESDGVVVHQPLRLAAQLFLAGTSANAVITVTVRNEDGSERVFIADSPFLIGNRANDFVMDLAFDTEGVKTVLIRAELFPDLELDTSNNEASTQIMVGREPVNSSVPHWSIFME